MEGDRSTRCQIVIVDGEHIGGSLRGQNGAQARSSEDAMAGMKRLDGSHETIENIWRLVWSGGVCLLFN